ncbi:OmpA family protein [Paracidovorax konjaci]|uniref:Outer membrane protein OmpA n=1 Tax=Paracidovorax konjaci TaxID=32040 RepID=A0A1I1S8F8_9BURK|nr:OmpA family protein [Paracidovorax konjaci]SFD42779.1 Outer membrane protein OmpA [Paracidovorax konjaci]
MLRRIRAWLLRAALGEAAPSAMPPSGVMDRLREARAANQLAEAELRRATAEKERRQALESHSKRLTGYIDTAKTAIPLIAAGYGVLATFLYCFMAIQFFPSGLSVGDNLLFVFVALGFGLLALVLAGLGLAAFIPFMIFEAAEKRNAAKKGWQGQAEFWILAPALSKAASFLFLWTLYASPFAPSDSATSGLIASHAFAAMALGGLMAGCAWRSGTGAGILKGSEWIFLGCCYGVVELWLLPWLGVVLPQYAFYVLVFPWIAGLLAWVFISAWTRPTGALKKDTGGDEPTRRPRPPAAIVALFLGGVALILAMAAGTMAWPFEPAPAHADNGTTHGSLDFWFSCAALMALFGAFFAQTVSRPESAGASDRPTHAPESGGATLPEAIGEPVAMPPIQNAYALESRIYFSLLLLLVIYGTVLWVDSQIDGKLSSGIFRSLGLRAEQQTLRLKGEALALVRSQADHAGIFLSFCAEPGGAALVTPVDALWHGMGTRSLLRIGKEPDGGKKSGRADPRTDIEVSSEEVKIVRNARARCHDIEHAVYFQSDSVKAVNSIDDLVDEVARVQESLSPLASPGDSRGNAWRLDKVVVTGHSDPLPLSDAGNQGLSERRAACVAEWVTRKALKGTQLTGDYRLETPGRGSRDLSAGQCPQEGRTANLHECHEKNRRVTVRLILARKPPLSDDVQHALFRQAERASAEADRPVACTSNRRSRPRF